MKTNWLGSSLLALGLGLSLAAAGRSEEAPAKAAPAEASAKAAAPVEATPAAAPAVGTNVWDLTRTGDGIDLPIAFQGFGPISLVASSYTAESSKAGAWEDKGAFKTLAVGNFAAELRATPPDWKAVRELLPPAKSGDQIATRKFMWNGVSAWLVDMTLSPQAHPGLAATRQRYLVAPLESGFLVLAFRGPPDRFAADRPAMRRAALSVRFRMGGMVAEYFNSTTLECLNCLQVDTNIDFTWGLGGPENGVGPDCFSIRWTGKLKSRYSETYTFTTVSDDGVRLWVNGQQLVDNWTIHPSAEDTGSITLKGGEEADIRMEFYENLVHAAARLLWQSTSQPREPVPADCLSAVPPPGLTPPPELGGGSLSAPPGWPVLLYSELPGGYTVATSPGAKWEGKRGAQTLTIGQGNNAVQVSLSKVRITSANVKSLLASTHPLDQIEVQKVAWRYAYDMPASSQRAAPAGAPASPVFTLLAPEHYAWAWSVDCTLNPQSHPETKLLYRWYCLVPLKRALLSFSFASADKDWMQNNWDPYRTTFDSVSLTVEEQQEETSETEDAVF